MHGNDFGAFLDRFAEVKADGGGNYVVPCPAHNDSHPSLVLAIKDDGRLVLHCRAGCSTKDAVLPALGLQPRDLFGWSAPSGIETKGGPSTVGGPGPGEIAALTTYVDAAGRELYAGETTWAVRAAEYVRDRFGLDIAAAIDQGLGVDTGGGPFPYRSAMYRRYPRLVVPLAGFDGVHRGVQGRDLSGQCSARWLSATNPEGRAWSRYGVFRGGGSYGVYLVTEGPGDALTAAAAGYDAVAVRGAALASNAALAAEIADGTRGSHVVVAGDRDDAGQRFNRAVAEALRGHGVTVHALELPDLGRKTDLTAWRESVGDGFAALLHDAVRSARPVDESDEQTQNQGGTDMSTATSDMVTRDDGERAVSIIGEFKTRFGDADTAALRAHSLVEFTGGRIRHSPGLGYAVWTGRIWEWSEMRVRQEIHRMGAALAMAGRPVDAKGFLNTSSIDNILTELRAVPAVHCDASAFDARADLLSVRNGTVNLRTGELRPHSMADMITRYVDVDYRPDAACPRWEQFLAEIFPEHPELPAYMQRLVGYGNTGSTSEQCCAVLWGGSANGKSVFMDALPDTFSAVEKTAPFSTFEEKPNGGIPNDLAALQGHGIVRASEGESGKPMAEAVLKRATGSDTISARFLRQEFFEFRPTFLLLMDTNH